MKQTDPQYKLRLPQELKEKLESASRESGRSMNAEIVERLSSSIDGSDPGAVLSTIGRLEKQLAETGARLDETERLALLMSMALASCYGITKSVLDIAPDDTQPVSKVLAAGVSAVRAFASNYKPKGMEPLAKSFEHLKSILAPDAYQALIDAVSVSDETNELVREGEERALSVINGVLDKHGIEEAPNALPYAAFISMQVATRAHFPDPQQTLEDAVNGPLSDDPKVLEEQARRRPGEPVVWLMLAQHEEGEQNFQAAAEFARKVLALSPAGSPMSRSAESLLDRCRAATRADGAQATSDRTAMLKGFLAEPNPSAPAKPPRRRMNARKKPTS